LITYLVRRLLIAIPVLLGITIITFAVLNLTPGDPIRMMLVSEQITPSVAEQLTVYYGLDQPWYVQYARYLGNLLRGNLGISITSRTSVARSIFQRLPNTMLLAFSSMVLALLIAIPVGVISATYRNSMADYAALTSALIGVSMPSYWLGLILLLQFGLTWKLLPIWGIGHLSDGLWDFISHLILPTVTLGANLAALLSRLTRASVLEVLGEDYVRTAKAKGLRGRVVLYKHALRNALIPVITTAGLQFGYLMGGTVIIESIFSWPGLGRLTVQAIQKRDLPVIQSATLVFAVLFVVVTLLVDVLYVFIDPRIRYD
jgi:ABC-type dipeptide/oligopeptide/nickel transport system permease component